MGRHRDAIEAVVCSALHPLVHRAGRDEALDAVRAYFATLPPADLESMKPQRIAELATSYVKGHGKVLRLAMRDDQVERDKALDTTYAAIRQGWNL